MITGTIIYQCDNCGVHHVDRESLGLYDAPLVKPPVDESGIRWAYAPYDPDKLLCPKCLLNRDHRLAPLQNSEEALAMLRPLLTPDLCGAVFRFCLIRGWLSDFHETSDFVQKLYQAAGLPPPLDEEFDPMEFPQG